MQIFYTILTGTLVFVLGQIFLKLILEPIHDFKRAIAEIAFTLNEHAPVFSNPGAAKPEKEKEVSASLRKLASKLESSRYLIPFYRFFSLFPGFPSQDNLVKALKNLIGLVNGFGGNNPDRGMINAKRSQNVRDALGIYIPEHERLPPD